MRIGQVWEGTDNQTRVGKQGIVLSVFAGPVSAGRRAPTREDFKDELKHLYPETTLDQSDQEAPLQQLARRALHQDRLLVAVDGEILRVGEKLSKPFHDRLFFAGEHTQMDFFGYMEGALRSGERAADTLMLKACGLLKSIPHPRRQVPPI